MKFKLWSQVNPDAKKSLMPEFQDTPWQDLTEDTKTDILRHLLNSKIFTNPDIVISSLHALNNKYKQHTYARSFFEHGGPHFNGYGKYDICCEKVSIVDLKSILITHEEHVVIEMLSIYFDKLIYKTHLEGNPSNKEINAAYEHFDQLSSALNEIFEQYNISLKLNRESFYPRQDPLIEELVIEPTIKLLSAPKWNKVQDEFKDALVQYHKSTPASYSSALTSIVSGLQAFLQILVNGEPGKGDIAPLIREGIKRKLIPGDALSEGTLKNIGSIIMSKRQKEGDAHPKKEYANQESVRLILNITLVFIQHVVLSQK